MADIYDYKPNSHAYKREQALENKKIEKVANGKLKKRSALSHDMENIKTYALKDVLIPALQKAVVDIVRNGVEMLVYRGEKPPSSRNSALPYVSYNKYGSSSDRRYSEPRSVGYGIDDIVLETRGEAVEVLRHMDAIVDSYGVLSVLDLFDLVGIRSTPNDNKYGWTNIRSAEIVRVSGGYTIRMPKPLPI